MGQQRVASSVVLPFLQRKDGKDDYLGALLLRQDQHGRAQNIQLVFTLGSTPLVTKQTSGSLAHAEAPWLTCIGVLWASH